MNNNNIAEIRTSARQEHEHEAHQQEKSKNSSNERIETRINPSRSPA